MTVLARRQLERCAVRVRVAMSRHRPHEDAMIDGGAGLFWPCTTKCVACISVLARPSDAWRVCYK